MLTKEQALEMLKEKAGGKAAREAEMRADGFPAYTTSAGWLGYSDEKIVALLTQYLAEGMTHFKMKVGADIEDDVRRARVMRATIGPDNKVRGYGRWRVRVHL